MTINTHFKYSKAIVCAVDVCACVCVCVCVCACVCVCEERRHGYRVIVCVQSVSSLYSSCMRQSLDIFTLLVSAVASYRYMAKPFLIDGFKFDLRIYVFVQSFDPLRVFV